MKTKIIITTTFWILIFLVAFLSFNNIQAQKEYKDTQIKIDELKTQINTKSEIEKSKENYDNLISDRINNKKIIEVLTKEISEVIEPKIRCERQNLTWTWYINCETKYTDFVK